MTEYIRIFWEKKRELEGLNHISKSKIFHLDEGEICYDDTGEHSRKNLRNKPIIICLPGAGDMRTQFRCTTPMLFSSGYRVISVDIRGMGNSSTNWKSCNLMDVANDIEALCSHLKISIHRGVILMAHGESAAVALLLASKRVDLIRCLVLISPIFKSNPNPLGIRERLMHNLLPNWCASLWFKYYESLYGDDRSMFPLDHEKYVEIVRNQMKNPNRYELCIKYLSSPKEIALGKLSMIRCPIYIAKGNAKCVAQFDRTINNVINVLKDYVPIIELKIYNSGHFIHIESSYQLGQDISEWIDKNYIPIWKEEGVGDRRKKPEERLIKPKPKKKRSYKKNKTKFKFVERRT